VRQKIKEQCEKNEEKNKEGYCSFFVSGKNILHEMGFKELRLNS
jgi:hypothetical protein